MAIIKCKMCGGDLNVVEDATVAECEYCGTKQTVPKVDDEKKLTLFARAGRLLRACEFDKAAGVFETIVADFPDEAEAYWGLVLCKYGIEYVDDPATGKKIPTCHRSSFDSVLDDANFEQACENTDAVARRVYRDEARAIEDLRQAILQVSGKEEPYDVFISYKETDANGERTLDSVIAQDIYKELTGEGYRVFFSRISLEDKLGTEYEPYIFAALNSAKVMLVVGTDYENLDSVWVKNEWSRFLKLIAKGEKKTLIPVFKNMDAYDMPKEFAKLSAQDMGKVGAMQDLVRGVEKIVGKKKAEPEQTQPTYVSSEADAKTAAAVKRGRLALEESNWEQAKSYFEQALTLDAECAEAYFGMALAEARCRTAEEYKQRAISQTPEKRRKSIGQASEHINEIADQKMVQGFLDVGTIKSEYLFDLSYSSETDGQKSICEKEKRAFDNNRNFNLAYRFAKGPYKETLENYRTSLYSSLEENILKAEKEDSEAAEKKLSDYKDYIAETDKKIEELSQKKQAERERYYRQAVEAFSNAETSAQYWSLKQKFVAMGDYKDSEEYKNRCETCAIEAGKKEEEEREERQKENLYARYYRIFNGTDSDTIKNWEFAKEGFESLGDFRDARTCAKKCAERIAQIKNAEEAAAEEAERKRKAEEEEAERQRIAAEKAEVAKKAKKKKIKIVAAVIAVLAIAALILLTAVIIPGNRYKTAEALLEAGQYEEAFFAFGKAGNYKDAQTKKWSLLNQIAKRDTVYAGYNNTVGLRTDGTVVAVGLNSDSECEVSGWTDIVAVSAGRWHTVGLHSDGTVVATGSNTFGQCEVSGWTDIVAVSAGYYQTVGLRSDGTVVATGDNKNGQCDVSKWTDIVSISSGGYHTVGLRSDGTVVAVGYNEDGRCNVSGWTNIVAVSAGGWHTVGLRSDGTVVATGDNIYCKCEVDGWTDIVAVSAGGNHTVGLRSDGTVVSAGWDEVGQRNVSIWSNIVAVYAGGAHTVGLRSNGTVVTTGWNDYGQCDVSDWTNIKLPNT